MNTTHERCVKVIVRVSARHASVEEVKPNVYEVSVRTPARQGQANEHVRMLVAAHLGVPASHIRIVSGHRRPRKLLTIRV